MNVAAGIAGYAAYIPWLRIRKEEYQKAWGGCASDMDEKTVADIDEDSLTMAVEAGRQALLNVDPARVDVLAVASTTFPYAEKVANGTVAAALGLRRNVVALETAGSTLAGAQALLLALDLLANKERALGLVLVADNPAALPKDEIEHGLAAAACAFLLAREDPAVPVEGWTGQVRESLGSRFRRQGEPFLQDLGLKTLAADAPTAVVGPAVSELLLELGRVPQDYGHAVFTQSGARQAANLGRGLGFTREQMETGLLFKETGDTGACSALLGLCAVLDQASGGERILLAAHGSGAGAVCASLAVRAPAARGGLPVREQLDRKKYIDYVQYLKLRGHIL